MASFRKAMTFFCFTQLYKQIVGRIEFPMTAEVQEILQWLHNRGKGQADHSAIAQYYEMLTGIQIGR